jgi:hypothetical protein
LAARFFTLSRRSLTAECLPARFRLELKADRHHSRQVISAQISGREAFSSSCEVPRFCSLGYASSSKQVVMSQGRGAPHAANPCKGGGAICKFYKKLAQSAAWPKGKGPKQGITEKEQRIAAGVEYGQATQAQSSATRRGHPGKSFSQCWSIRFSTSFPLRAQQAAGCILNFWTGFLARASKNAARMRLAVQGAISGDTGRVMRAGGVRKSSHVLNKVGTTAATPDQARPRHCRA